MKRGMARPPLRVGGTPPAMRAESGRRACCSATSVSCAAVSTDTWQRRMGRNIAVSLRRWSDNKKRSPSVGRQGLLNRLHPRARKYSQTELQSRGCHAGRHAVCAPARAACRTHRTAEHHARKSLPAKTASHRPARRSGRRAFRPRPLAAPVSIPGFTCRFQSRCARRQRRRTCSTARATARRHARDACAVVACAISGAAPDTRLASVVATVLA